MNKYKIMWSTFFKKGVPNIDDNWGVYFISGFQGSGKTYLSVMLLLKLVQDMKVYTNIQSLTLPKNNVEKFEKIEEIVDNVDEHSVFVIDEISAKYTKDSRTDKPFYRWLQQSRKRGRIVILLTQEWKEIPMWLRRPARFLYTTRKLPLLPIFITTKGDAMNTILNKDTLEWECPILMTYIYKRNQCIAKLYDTFEPINEL